MFRLTHYLRLLKGKSAIKRPKPVFIGKGPIVIWNLTGICNLKCLHCYASSISQYQPNELDTTQALQVLEDLKKADCFSVILSGGEPLYRQDLFVLAERAKELGLFVTLSTNGTMIGKKEADQIKSVGLDYVGISLDGMDQIHDEFRGIEGSFDRAVSGLLRCRDLGINVGVRFTLTKKNSIDLPKIFDFIEKYEIKKLYLSHLVYSGRGNVNRLEGLAAKETRKTIAFVLQKAKEYVEKGSPIEIVTGNNEADAVFLLLNLLKEDQEGAEKLLPILKKWGGNSAGTGIVNIDALGNVHPDPLMYNINIGNVLERKFSEIWNENDSEILHRLRARPRKLKGRCGECAWINICGGASRTRALQKTGDFWESDPVCYITDKEIHCQPFSGDLKAAPALGMDAKIHGGSVVNSEFQSRQDEISM